MLEIERKTLFFVGSERLEQSNFNTIGHVYNQQQTANKHKTSTAVEKIVFWENNFSITNRLVELKNKVFISIGVSSSRINVGVVEH